MLPNPTTARICRQCGKAFTPQNPAETRLEVIEGVRDEIETIEAKIKNTNTVVSVDNPLKVAGTNQRLKDQLQGHVKMGNVILAMLEEKGE